MQSIEALRAVLPDIMTIVHEVEGKVIVKIGTDELSIPVAEYDKYSAVKEQLISTDTSIFCPGYYEHYIENLSRYGTVMLLRGEQKEICIESTDGGSKICISPLSYSFIFSKLRSEQFFKLMRRMVSARRRYDATGGPIPFEILSERFLSIKITLAQGHKFYNNKDQISKLADACLFNIAYNTGNAFSLARSWEKNFFKLGNFRTREHQFPSRLYNSDLIAYYQLALSSESLILSYIGLYKIVEHFFITSTEKVLHKRVADLLVTPDFSYKKPAKLRQLVQLIRKFDTKTNEQQMLVTVLEEHFMVDEIVDWVISYEQKTSFYYTIPQTFLEVVYHLDLNPNHVFSSLAKRIYNIRNLLVHSKEGDMPKYIPFSGQEEFIANELPILSFVAENLIIKTGTEI